MSAKRILSAVLWAAWPVACLADVYPSEVYPPDATILLLDGETNQETGLAYVAKGTGSYSTPTYEVQYNRRLLRQNALLATIGQGRVVDEGALTFGVFPMDYYLGGTLKSFAGATAQSATDDDTNHVWIDSANALQVATNGLPADLTAFVPLAVLTTSGGDITAIEDLRGAVLFAAALGGGDVDLEAHVTGTLPVGNGGTGETSDYVVPYSPTFHISGTLSVQVYTIEWVAPVQFKFKSATGRVGTAPTGASLIVDVRDDGASLFASQGEMINVAASEQQDTSATKDAIVAVGSVITIEVEQVGSSVAGADLTMVLDGRAPFSE